MFDILNAKRANRSDLLQFAIDVREIQSRIDFKISARGWCYQLEQAGIVNKGQFDRVENYLNECRKRGILPIDFIAEEEGRQFSGIEEKTDQSPAQFLKGYVRSSLDCHDWYTPDWWDGEDYYIQMLVEKIDLKTLFTPVCEKYHIPIATSKGWSSMLQRAQYAKRFKEAEERGLTCVLLYCGDHDPDGLRISDFIRKNLVDIENIKWENGERGYSPDDLVIQRFGLDAKFIRKHKLTWIDNLITGSGRDLASRNHRNHKMPYVQEYIKEFGERKCEANAIVPMPVEARELVEKSITDFVGLDAADRFEAKKEAVSNEISELADKVGLTKSINLISKRLDNEG